MILLSLHGRQTRIYPMEYELYYILCISSDSDKFSFLLARPQSVRISKVRVDVYGFNIRLTSFK